MRKASKNRLLTLAEALKKLKIVLVEISYSGGGDSGQIDSVRANDSKGMKVDIKDTTVIGTVVSDEQNSKGEWIRKEAQSEIPLEEALNSFCEDHLSDVGIDWYNNEGGSGTQTIDVTGRSATLQHSTNVMTTEESEYTI